jgi:hypothetical protein
MKNFKFVKESEWLDYNITEDEFYDLDKIKRWRLRNPEKVKESGKKWRDENREYNIGRQRAYQLKSKYNMTEDDYNIMYTAQEGRCAICSTDTPTGKWKVFAIDHCHESGKIRGLLCNECNRGMGLLKDSVAIVKATLQYLLSHKKETAEQRKKR